MIMYMNMYMKMIMIMSMIMRVGERKNKARPRAREASGGKVRAARSEIYPLQSMPCVMLVTVRKLDILPCQAARHDIYD